MSTPGWYPDPAGNPGHFRWWDGAQWAPTTTTDPVSGAGGAPLGSPGQGGEPQREGGGLRTLLAVLAGLLVLALLVWALFFRGGGSSAMVPEDTNSASPTGPMWDEKSTPTPSSTGSAAPAPSNAAALACPVGGGNVIPSSGDELTSAGLRVDRIKGWDFRPSFDLAAIHDVQVQLQVVYDGGIQSWLSGQMVGRLAKGDGFNDPKLAASQIMSCFATSSYYQDYTGREDLLSEEVTIDGHKGWHLQTNIRVDSPGLPGIPGDRMDIVVVDTGLGDSLAIYAGWATIGDTERCSLVDQAVKSLRAA